MMVLRLVDDPGRLISEIKLGTLADWVGAIGTVSALFLGVYVLRSDLRAREVEALRRARDDDDRLRYQASRVSSEWQFIAGIPSNPEFAADILTPFVRNDSDRPIYHVRGRRIHAPTGEVAQTFDFAATVLAGEHKAGETMDTKPDGWLLSVQFVDDDRNAWSREGDGTLIRLS